MTIAPSMIRPRQSPLQGNGTRTLGSANASATDDSSQPTGQDTHGVSSGAHGPVGGSENYYTAPKYATTPIAETMEALLALNLAGLAPVAWLMAQIFQLPNGVGWWATPLFVVPLFTTRLAYARYVETRELFEQTIEALSKAVDARDPYTRNHSSRVSHIAEAMCRVMRLPEPEIEKIKWAGLLHDVGKIGIRDNILLKEGPLDREERVLMNQHPTIGAEIVAPASQLAAEAPLIRAHHEWFNGSGYPEGREALDIPRGARILTIADAYEAMTSDRVYRPRMQVRRAVAVMIEGQPERKAVTISAELSRPVSALKACKP